MTVKRQGNYKNFNAALYVRALDLAPLKGDISPFVEEFEKIYDDVKIDKVYLETHRDLVIPSDETLELLKEYFDSKGIETASGITITIDEKANFKTYCYSDPLYRGKLSDLMRYTAKHFDEIVLDDFFFTNCKCPLCIEEKGDRSWTDFRLDQMTKASTELILDPAKEVNPDAKVIIKYPNWYEHFQGLGFNLKDQPPIFDGLYTGNETRDAVMSAQHLQPYESYLVTRYYENIKPSKNFGGWVDPFGSKTLDRYAEQLWLTLFAKAPEIMLFDYFSIRTEVTDNQRGSWQGSGTSFNYDLLLGSHRNDRGRIKPGSWMSLAAGEALRQIDDVIGELGNPLGIKSYRPYNATGEDFLHNYMGMLGLPMDLRPEYPEDAETIFLTESGKFDDDIVEKIKKSLMEGKRVMITSGLYRALQDKGIRDIVELNVTNRKLACKDFVIGMDMFSIEEPITFSFIEFLTNDSWEDISCIGGASGTPLVHRASYGNSMLYILNVPDNFADLYKLPKEALNRIRDILSGELSVRMRGPSNISLFLYDNDTFIVHSFEDEPVDIELILKDDVSAIRNVETGDEIKGRDLYSLPGRFGGSITKRDELGFDLLLKPHSYYAFKIVK